MKAAVLAIVVVALRRVSARALRTRTALALACVSLAGIRLFDVPFPVIVIDVAQQAVDVKAWLAPGEMLDALALAETTPGPLVLVLQHVGFLAAWRGAGTQSPWIHGALGALIAAWVTFVPSFVWIFAGAPFIEQARRSRSLQGALAAITAAIVGVIASLALWFALHVVFAQVDAVHIGVLHLPWPDPSSIHLGATAISLVALVVALRGGVGTPLLLAGGALFGVAWSALAGG